MNPTDQELLSEYANTASEAAFTAVVERQVNLVYSAALRLTAGDNALTEDITQKVFCDLANKASIVSRAASIAGWLHTHTRFISLTAIRGERRRRIREQEASAMHDQNSTAEFNWSQLRPLLDEAVGELRPADRDAVILRFFENKSHREVGETLGLNENAARMKIERALEKLQTHFVRRGVTISSAVIATAMCANSVQAAPVGLGSKVAGTSLATATHAGSLAHFFSKIASMSTKTKIIIVAMVVAILASLPLTIQYQRIIQLRKDFDVATNQVTNLRRQLARASTALNQGTNLTLNAAGSSLATTATSLGPSVQYGTLDGHSVIVPINADSATKLVPVLDLQDYTLTPQAIAMLNLTPGETARLQDVFAQVRDRIRQHERDTIKPIPVDSFTGPNFTAFFQNHPGQQSMYQIPPMSPEDNKALSDWYTNSVNSIVGPERGTIMAGVSTPVMSQLLTSGQGTVIAFVDDAGTDGQTPQTAWLIRTTGSDGKMNVVRGSGTDAVPPSLAHLFQEIKSSPSSSSP